MKRKLIERELNVERGAMREVSESFINEAWNKFFKEKFKLIIKTKAKIKWPKKYENDI